MRHAFAEDDHIAGSGKNRHGHFIFLFCLAAGIGEICLVTARYGRKGAVFDLCHIRKNNNAFCARALELPVRVVVGVVDVSVGWKSAVVEAGIGSEPDLLDVVGCGNEDGAASES